jgi:hypothetical protein
VKNLWKQARYSRKPVRYSRSRATTSRTTGASPIKALQRDLYKAVKSDPVLAQHPVWSISEPGAQRDDIGLQFLTIPPRRPNPDARRHDVRRLRQRTQLHLSCAFAASGGQQDVGRCRPICRIQSGRAIGNFGVTWARRFRGYTQEQLNMLPRVTTETGTNIEGPVTEEMHGLNRTCTSRSSNVVTPIHRSICCGTVPTKVATNPSASTGPTIHPRKAAIYLHNPTTILADKGTPAKPGRLDFTIVDQPKTVHALLLQYSGGTFQLIVWNERLSGQDRVTVHLCDTRTSVRIALTRLTRQSRDGDRSAIFANCA